MARFLKKSPGDRYDINLEGRRPADGRGLRKAERDGERERPIQDYGSFTSLLNNEVSPSDLILIKPLFLSSRILRILLSCFEDNLTGIFFTLVLE